MLGSRLLREACPSYLLPCSTALPAVAGSVATLLRQHGQGRRGVGRLGRQCAPARLQADVTATAARLEELMGAAVRVESLADQGLLTPAEAGGLSAELADCLKLHRQYMAAITAHAAVSMADCARAFECDRQLAHVSRG